MSNKLLSNSPLKSIFCFTYMILMLPALAIAQDSKGLIKNLTEYAKTSAITGRESLAASYLQSILPDHNLQKDKLGNLYVVIGKGEPKKLITTPLDEPGYVISEIQEDGFIRIAPLGSGYEGNLYHQFLQGHEIIIQSEEGIVNGVATLPSMHYERLRKVRVNSRPVVGWQDIFIDIGANSSEEVARRGIQLLDPVTLNKKISVVKNSLVTGPAMRTKAAAIALANVINSTNTKDVKGTLVIAFTTLELINGKGFEAILNQLGPFKEIYRFNRFLTLDKIGENKLLSNAQIMSNENDFINTTPSSPLKSTYSNRDKSGKIFEVGLPCLYPSTPVELVDISDVENLTQYWLKVVGENLKVKDLKSPQELAESVSAFKIYSNEFDITSKLVATYGVSSDEKNVRSLILQQLPKWAKPTVDEKGNIIVSVGKGKTHNVFVAHMDETGYFVESIDEKGFLTLGVRGGMLPYVWEAQPAVIHGSKGDISAVFQPRENYLSAEQRATDNPLKVFAGFNSKEEAEAAGMLTGTTTVTMPKEMIRISEHRASARAFDDRVGCAALLLSINKIDPNQMSSKATFIWAVEEEIGLLGSSFASEKLSAATTVYPVDTFVSSDDPYTEENFANCPLGEGMVIRVLESINFVSRENLKATQNIAEKYNIKTQYGMTAGGTDGQAFLAYGIPSIPLSWPGRYSHSPVETMDFRDMQNLVKLINAIIKEN